MRQRQMPVSYESLMGKAHSLIKKHNPDFEASRGWAVRFCERHELSLRAKTSMAQKLPADLETKIVQFYDFLKDVRQKGQYHPAVIGNMDETPMYFDIVPNKTLNKVGAKTIVVCTTGAEKRHLTVVLSCTANGEMHPPMIIFKRKTDPKVTVPPGFVVTANEKGWMNETLMVRWLTEIWMKEVGRKSLLVMDSFRGHLTDRVKSALKQRRVIPAIIPGGCTSKLQPLDVSINKPFKQSLRKSWSNWLWQQAEEETTQKIKSPTPQDIVNWVQTAYQELKERPALIQKSFLICGISNSLDGTEDHLIHNPTEQEEQIPEVDVDELFGEEEEDFEFDGFSQQDD